VQWACFQGDQKFKRLALEHRVQDLVGILPNSVDFEAPLYVKLVVNGHFAI